VLLSPSTTPAPVAPAMTSTAQRSAHRCSQRVRALHDRPRGPPRRPDDARGQRHPVEPGRITPAQGSRLLHRHSSVGTTKNLRGPTDVREGSRRPHSIARAHGQDATDRGCAPTADACEASALVEPRHYDGLRVSPSVAILVGHGTTHEQEHRMTRTTATTATTATAARAGTGGTAQDDDVTTPASKVRGTGGTRRSRLRAGSGRPGAAGGRATWTLRGGSARGHPHPRRSG
jgi:hypothetical protein